MNMWPVIFNKLDELWVVGEFSRELPETKDAFYWRSAAEHCVSVRNARLKRGEEATMSFADDTGPDPDFWPGGLVTNGASCG